jgi:hypothetical protein
MENVQFAADYVTETPELLQTTLRLLDSKPTVDPMIGTTTIATTATCVPLLLLSPGDNDIARFHNVLVSVCVCVRVCSLDPVLDVCEREPSHRTPRQALRNWHQLDDASACSVRELVLQRLATFIEESVREVTTKQEEKKQVIIRT